jgi:hypothetical protein
MYRIAIPEPILCGSRIVAPPKGNIPRVVSRWANSVRHVGREDQFQSAAM